MKHIDTLIESKTFWNNIPLDARATVIDAFYILYGTAGFGNNDMWLKDLPAEAITVATNNITLNAVRFTKYLEYIEIVGEMLSWDIERVNFLRNTLKMHKLTKKGKTV